MLFAWMRITVGQEIVLSNVVFSLDDRGPAAGDVLTSILSGGGVLRDAEQQDSCDDPATSVPSR